MTSKFQELPHGITRIEVEYLRPGFTSAWLVREGDQAVFVETGPLPSLTVLLDALTWHGLSPSGVQAVIVTHVHLDHAGAAGALLHHLPNARLMVHPCGVPHLIDPSCLIEGAKVVYGPERFLATLGGAIPVEAARIHTPMDGETFFLGNRPLTFLDTPGHCLHHLCLWDEKSHGIFTGDAFGLSYREFDGGKRPLLLPATTPTQFDVDQSVVTWDRLAALQPTWLYLTHFGQLRFVPSMKDDLMVQVEKYQQCVPKTNEKISLMDHLLGITQEQMGLIGVPTSGVDQLRLLEMDLELNAKGLAIWHKRRSKS